MRKLLALIALLLPGLVIAQTVPGSAIYSWTLPTTGCTAGITPCDNAPLTGAAALTAVEAYISTSPIPDSSSMAPTLTLGPGATTATYSTTVANGSTLYARFKAVNANGKSGFSAQVSKLIVLPVVPNVPTSVTVTIQVGP